MNRRTKLIASLACGATLLALLAVVVAQATRTSSDVDIDVKEAAHATDQGVTLSVDGATFSGTATYLLMSVDASGVGQASEVTAVGIPADGLTMAGLHLPLGVGAAELWAAGLPSQPVRMTPMQPTAGAPTLLVTSINVTSANRGTTRINGNWPLTLKGPEDVNGALRTQDLRGSASPSPGGVSIELVSARRSRAETVVSLRATGSNAFQALDQPELLSEGSVLAGRVASFQEDGKQVEVVFPATGFDTGVVVRWRPFAVAGEGARRSAQIDLGAAMLRQGLSATFGSRGALGSEDVISTSGSVEIRSFDFARTSAQGDADLLGLSVVGNWLV